MRSEVSYTTKDGVLILTTSSRRTKTGLVRVFYTDSGHYLMPISSFVRDEAYHKNQAELKRVVLAHFSKISRSL